jgi:hypothetical protein
MKLLPISGAAFAVLAFTATALYPKAPEAFAADKAIAQFYADHDGRLILVQALYLLAAAPLITFVALLCQELMRRTGARAAAAVVGAAGTAAVAVMMVAATMDLVAASRADAQGAIDPAAAAVLFDLGIALFSTAAPIVWAPAVLAVGMLALRGRALPRWLGAVSVVLGVALLVPPAGLVAMIVLHFWVVALSVLFARRERPAAPA